MQPTSLLTILLFTFTQIISAQLLTPTADGYIYPGGANLNTNYGTETQLRSRYSPDAQYARLSYIRFDISSMNAEYSSVTFNLYGKSTTSKMVDVYSAFGNWTDTSLNGSANAKPSLSDFVGSFQVGTSDQYYAVEVAPYINYLRKKGIQTITFVVADQIQQQSAVEAFYHSKENSSGKTPYLQFTAGSPTTLYDAPVTIYVDAEGGNDQASGLTPSEAWKSLERVGKHFFKSEDKLLFRRESVFKGSLFIKHLKNSNAQFEIGSYGTGKLPILDAEGNEFCTLKIFNQSNILIKDLEITNFSEEAPMIRRGIYCHAEDAGEIKNIHFKGLKITNINGRLSTDDGDLIGKSNCGIFSEITGINVPTRWNGYTMEDCHFYRVDRHGTANQSSWQNRTLTTNTNWYPSINMHFKGNIFEECASDGLIVRVAHKPVMEYNLFTRCSYKLSGNACFSFNTDSALWQFNESRYTVYQTGDHDAGGFDSDYKSKYTIIQYNYSHHNEYGGILITGGPSSYGGFNEGTIVRHNIFYNNGHHGIRLSGLATNTRIYNNTSYNDDNTKEPSQPYDEFTNFRMLYHKNWGGWPTNTRYTNNIYYYINSKASAVQDLSTASSTGTEFSNNLIDGTNVATFPNDAKALRANPEFAQDVSTAGEGLQEMKKFTLRASSPCIDYGLTISGAAKFDFAGNPVPVNGITDLGAFEYNPATSITNTEQNQHCIQFKNNPVNDSLVFSFKQPTFEPLTFRVLNMQGKTLYESQLKDNNEHRIDLSELINGAYILSVGQPNQALSAIFMKL